MERKGQGGSNDRGVCDAKPQMESVAPDP
jgi:hypothetical protein